MIITVANEAGFCFGVNRAVEKVYSLLDKCKKVYTLGPIIHNPQIVSELFERGVKVIENPENVEDGATLVIRSHGVAREVIDKIKSLKIDYVDCTCPFVAKIHRIVENVNKNDIILIAGNETHPEVKGIIGHCNSSYYVFNDSKSLKNLLQKNENICKNNIVVVSQTTFDIKEWNFCLKILKKDCTKIKICDTICNATSNRQQEAQKIAKNSELMIVIGGRHSSNTAKLRDLCKQYCDTYLIETPEELPMSAIKTASKVGVTAGASTPSSIIKEVLRSMADTVNNNFEEEEINFEQMLEESLKNLNTDDKVHGVVVGISPTEAYVDVGRKQSGFIPLAEMSDDPNAKMEDLVKVGDELELLIMRTNDQEGTIMLSKKRIDAMKGLEKIAESYEKNEALSGVVVNIIKGGLIAVSNGVKIFIPASLSGVQRGEKLEDLLGKEIKFKIIELNKGKRRVVGSVKQIQKEEKEILKQKFWETVEVGQKFVGKVKTLTDYGAFVDLGGVDGMIHISELSWSRIKHPSEVVNVGDTVEVYVKDIDKQRSKISLGYKRTEDNPWEILKRDYKIGDKIEVQIAGMTNFGAFARILPGIDGLIHISQISNKRIEKPQDVLSVGDKVMAKIIDIDLEKKRISLSIRELLDSEHNEELKKENEVTKELEKEEKKKEKKPAKRTRKKKEETDSEDAEAKDSESEGSSTEKKKPAKRTRKKKEETDSEDAEAKDSEGEDSSTEKKKPRAKRKSEDTEAPEK